ncbi:MAG: tetratricopeptide repeat protein [Bacteroidia bacterium]|jgi:tetratricopeptide (TPR) repeat protein
MPLILLWVALVLTGISCTRSRVANPVPVSALSEAQQTQFQYYFFEGTTAKLIGKWEQAEQFFGRAFSLDPNSSVCAYEIARMAQQRGDASKAQRMAQKAVQLDAQNPWYLQFLAQVYQNNGLIREAADAWGKLVAMDNEHSLEALENLANLHLLNKAYSEAMDCADKLEARLGPQPEILDQKKNLWLLMGKKDKAIKEIQRLIILFPNELGHRLSLVQTYSVEGQYAKALLLLQEALPLTENPNRARLLLASSELYGAMGQNQKAEEAFDEALQGSVLAADEVLQGVFRILEKAGDSSSVKEKKLRRVLEFYPDAPMVHALLGEALVRQGKGMEALPYYCTALDMAKDQLPYIVWQQYLSALLDLGQMDTLEIKSKIALERYPSQALNYFFLGLALSQNLKKTDAIEFLQTGLEYTTDDEQEIRVQMHILLGDLYHQQLNHQLSDKNYRDALALQPNNALVLNNYAYYLSVRKESLDSALGMIRRALELEPNNASYLDTYAWVLYALGQYEKALEPMSQALRLSADNPTLLEHYGDILFRNNQTEEAKNQWSKALLFDEGNLELQSKIRSGLPALP